VRQQANTWFLLTLAALALYLSYLVAQPFLSAMFAAVVLAVAFYPLHAKIHVSLARANLAATLSTVLVIFVVAVPAVLLGFVVSRELGHLHRSLAQDSAAQGGGAYLVHVLEAPVRLLGRYVDLSQVDVRSTLLGWVAAASKYLVGVSGRAMRDVLSLIVDTVVVFFTLFFLFRDGDWFKQQVAAVLPLTREQSTRLLSRTSDTIVASVYGGIAVGLSQGLLASVGFWIVGVPAPALWGLVTALASLIPAVGTALVWVPAAVLLALSGHWIKAAILLAWGAAAGQTAAVVRPYVVAGRTKIHNLLIFLALLGGVRTFGFMGIFIGPVVVSVTIVLLDMLREANALPTSEERAKAAAE